jgi:hypothetical protein
MGCFKLQYYKNTNLMKVVHSATESDKRSVQMFLSVDPITKEYPELTPYQFASNTPIEAIDLDGLEKEAVTMPEKGSLWGDDQTGIFVNSTPERRENDPVGAFLLDISNTGLTLMGINNIDNAISTFFNPNSTLNDNINAGFDLIMAGAQFEGEGGGFVREPSPHYSIPKTMVKVPVEKPKIEISSAKKVNGNSLQSKNTQHGYGIKDPKGKIQEYGISGQKLNKNGTSPRIQAKLRTKYNGEAGYTGVILKAKMSDRIKSTNWEKGKVTAYKKSKSNPNPGSKPPNQKRP